MALLYVESTGDQGVLSDDATEDIPEGDLVVAKSGGGIALADNDVADRITGIALNLEAGDNIASHEYDYEAGIEDFVYQPSGNKSSDDMFPNDDDRVPVMGRHDGDMVLAETTPESNSGVTSSPNIGYMDVVGVVDTSNNDAPDAAGKIVEEGYSNDENDDSGSVTFNRSNNNFTPLGRAVRVHGEHGDNFPVTSFEQRIWIERDKSL